ncbi:hypothetical protein MJO29_013972 [Puccinia striiformis f. sp. tritici]|nr:hypothetical protein MJO29_013972 [Puccinia striiformis f. sp. tritici]
MPGPLGTLIVVVLKARVPIASICFHL